jgi:hypothetical protein
MSGAGRRLLVAVVVIVAAAAIGILARDRTAAGPAASYELVFAPGTAVELDPAIFDPIPHRRVGSVVWLELELGDTLVVTNRDDVVHEIWAIRVRPGETVSQTFTEYGTFSGECTFDMTVFIEVR